MSFSYGTFFDSKFKIERKQIKKYLKTVSMAILVMLFATSYASMSKKMEGKMGGDFKDAKIVEIATFQLKSGVTVEEFAKIDRTLEVEYIEKQPGFIARHSAATKDGEWVAIIYWASEKDADASIASFADAPATGAFMANMNVETMRAKRYLLQ